MRLDCFGLFTFFFIVWIGSAMPYSFVHLYCFLDLFGLFGWFGLFQRFILILKIDWTVVIVCTVLMLVLVLGKPWTFLIVIASWIGLDCLYFLVCIVLVLVGLSGYVFLAS